MKRKNKVLLIGLLSLTLFGFLYQLKRSSVLRERYSSKLEEMDLLYAKEGSYQNNLILSAFQMNLHLESLAPMFVKDSLGRTRKFSEMASGKGKIFLRFTDRHCDACYSAAIKKLKLFGDVVGSEKIILLVTFDGANTYNILTQQYKVRFPIYEIERHQLNSIPYERVNSPYIFISKDSLTLTGFFIPDKSLPELTDKYFEHVKQSLLLH